MQKQIAGDSKEVSPKENPREQSELGTGDAQIRIHGQRRVTSVSAIEESNDVSRKSRAMRWFRTLRIVLVEMSFAAIAFPAAMITCEDEPFLSRIGSVPLIVYPRSNIDSGCSGTMPATGTDL
jgi:hypothetical protein